MTEDEHAKQTAKFAQKAAIGIDVVADRLGDLEKQVVYLRAEVRLLLEMQKQAFLAIGTPKEQVVFNNSISCTMKF